MHKSILKLEAITMFGSTFRTTFKTKHGRMLYLSLAIRKPTCVIQDCFYLDRHQSPARPERQCRLQKLKNQMHRAVYLDLAYYKNGHGVVKQCSYYAHKSVERENSISCETQIEYCK